MSVARRGIQATRSVETITKVMVLKIIFTADPLSMSHEKRVIKSAIPELKFLFFDFNRLYGEKSFSLDLLLAKSTTELF